MSRTRSSEDRDDRNQEHEDGEEREQRRDENKDNANLHIRNLHPRTAEEDIKEAFSRYGEVTKCSVIRDPHSQESRCFGFATMSTPQEADDVIRELDVSSLDGRTISIQKARRAEPRQPTPGSYRGLKSAEELRRRDDFRGGFPPLRQDYPAPYMSDRFSRPPPRYPPSYDYPPPRIDRYIDRGVRSDPRGYERDRNFDRGYERDRGYDRGYERERGYERDSARDRR